MRASSRPALAHAPARGSQQPPIEAPLYTGACMGGASVGRPELLYIKFTRKVQTSLPALVLKGKSKTSWECIKIILGFYQDFNRSQGL